MDHGRDNQRCGGARRGQEHRLDVTSKSTRWRGRRSRRRRGVERAIRGRRGEISILERKIRMIKDVNHLIAKKTSLIVCVLYLAKTTRGRRRRSIGIILVMTNMITMTAARSLGWPGLVFTLEPLVFYELVLVLVFGSTRKITEKHRILEMKRSSVTAERNIPTLSQAKWLTGRL